MVIRILFVCHGNICRSPMAEFVMLDLIRKAGRKDDFIVASAATSREEIGNDTHLGTKNELKKHGIAFSVRKARQIEQKDYENFDLIIGMDDANIANLKKFFGSDEQNKIKKMLSFCKLKADVADPWYTHDFDATFSDISMACKAILEQF